MNTVRRNLKPETQFKVIKCKKNQNKRFDRFCAAVLLVIAILCVAFEKELTAPILIALISLPLWFGKKRYIEI